MLSSGGPLCFHWPRILYSLLDLILFELAVASTNFRQGLTSLTENELQEFLNIMQSATLGYSRYTSTRRRLIITTATINCCPSHENKKTSKRYSMVPFTPISCTLAAKSSRPNLLLSWYWLKRHLWYYTSLYPDSFGYISCWPTPEIRMRANVFRQQSRNNKILH